MRAVLGQGAPIRVVIVDRGDVIAPDMGPGPRPIVQSAMHELGVEMRLGAPVEALHETGVTLASGARIESAHLIWAAGISASPLTEDRKSVVSGKGGRIRVTLGGSR